MRLNLASAVLFVVSILACASHASAQPALAPGQGLALRVDAIGPRQSQIEIASPDGTKWSVETENVAVVPDYELKDGKYYSSNSVTVYFGPGTMTSSIEPALTKAFPCLMVRLPTDEAALNGSVRDLSSIMRTGRWDFYVAKSCVHRGRFNLS